MVGTDSSHVYLFTRANFPRLEELIINVNYQGDRDIPAKIQKELPNCKIRFNRKSPALVIYDIFLHIIGHIIGYTLGYSYLSIPGIGLLILGIFIHKIFFIVGLILIGLLAVLVMAGIPP